MEIKIDTKEKFVVLTPLSPVFSDKIAYKIEEILNKNAERHPANVILNFTEIAEAEDNAIDQLKNWFVQFYEKNASFVICHIQPAVKKKLKDMDLYDSLNITPTESEAWDIVQMEEMEREMFDEE